MAKTKRKLHGQPCPVKGCDKPALGRHIMSHIKRGELPRDFKLPSTRGVEAREEPRDALTAEYLVGAIRHAVGDEAVVISEAVTNFHVVSQHMRRTRPGTLFSSGGGSLGYNGGAAVGVKLARPETLVVAICGDGSYLFSQPSTVHWMARRYQAPFLHVVLNNGGWRAPRQAVLSVHPDGIAARAPDIDIHFPQPPDYAEGGRLPITPACFRSERTVSVGNAPFASHA